MDKQLKDRCQCRRCGLVFQWKEVETSAKEMYGVGVLGKYCPNCGDDLIPVTNERFPKNPNMDLRMYRYCNPVFTSEGQFQYWKVWNSYTKDSN